MFWLDAINDDDDDEVWILVHGYLRARFDLPSSINFRDIDGFPKLRAQNPH